MAHIVNISQNTPEWLAYRKNKIGASEASAICGNSPYDSPYSLWCRKLGLSPAKESTPAMERGKSLETQARWIYEESTGFLICPMVFESEEYPFLIASLDGMSVNLDIACEIKCLNLQQHDKQEIPGCYYPQLQQQMIVLGLKEIDYVGYHPQSVKPFYIIKCYRDEEFIEWYLSKAKAFYDCIQTFTAPELIPRDYQDFTQNAEYSALDAAYVDLDEKIKGLEKQKDEIRNLMEAMSEGNNIIGPYTKMTHYTSQGRIDYKKAVTDNLPEINVEKYRSTPIKSVRITKV